MTLRISQFAAAFGLGLLVMPGAVSAQAPRYQSPYTAPAGAPQAQPAPLPTPTAITANGTVVEDVVVRVNDQIISRSDLERSQAQLQQELQQNNVPADEAAERQKSLLRDMIDQQLLLSRAKELGLNADAEVIRRLDEIRKQNKLDSMEDLEKAARQQGVSFEDFKANIRNGILTQQVVRDEVGRHLQMTQGQEQAFYDAHKQEFEQPEQVRLSEILIPTPADAKDDIVAQAQAKANDVAVKVQAGGKFEDLAKTYSGGPTASQGGDLGLFKRGALAKVLEDKTFGLKAGESTAPIRTRQGFVILKVTEHQNAGVPPLKDVRAADPGSHVYAAASTRAARLPHEAAGRGLHRYQAGICGLGRKHQADQACVYGLCGTGGQEEEKDAGQAALRPRWPFLSRKGRKRVGARFGRFSHTCYSGSPSGSGRGGQDYRRDGFCRVRSGSSGSCCFHSEGEGGKDERQRQAEEDQEGKSPVRSGSAELSAVCSGGNRCRRWSGQA